MSTISKGDVAPIFDFSQTPLAKVYEGFYVKVLDNVFTRKECEDLIALAESDQEWTAAELNNDVVPDYRNSLRILRFDHNTADMIFQRLLPYIPELIEIEPGDEWEGVIGKPGTVEGTWNLVGVNERLSFLRYEKGHFFKPHLDGQIELSDGRQARVTLQIYLGEEGVQGGATRILGPKGKYVDIEPKMGRVLIFQQRGFGHSGEGVREGVKYTLRSDFMYRTIYIEEIEDVDE
ncbi:hypothetical protein JR316_0012158 [Psilocybe cubensis]|uniref:Uncharacterized protein n=2 Tax=Psilocybe cubensis TaxID=181762 RepID=A0ACB8GJ27_PSICU|nr:hypothetical protein JR316_0012158 [Psilocybe cubensis]KAH9475055.1 hypothetical protein JR316_0012158 [Psilocybe cubensis]